jgi:hypothetical protein
VTDTARAIINSDGGVALAALLTAARDSGATGLPRLPTPHRRSDRLGHRRAATATRTYPNLTNRAASAVSPRKHRVPPRRLPKLIF